MLNTVKNSAMKKDELVDKVHVLKYNRPWKQMQ